MRYILRYIISSIVLFILLIFQNDSKAEGLLEDNPGKRFKEITEVDITLYPDLKSTDISIFGLYLNMKLEEIVTEINHYDFLYVEKDVFNENRLYIYDDNGKDSANTLVYLILDEKTYDLKEIILYPEMMKYLIGNTKKLLTFEMLNQNSDIVKNFTGNPDQKKKILDIPSLHMESFAYFYPKRNLLLTKFRNDQKLKISLSLVNKLTN